MADDEKVYRRKMRNQKLVPTGRYLRKEMTREEKHLWYDFLKSYPVNFYRQKIIGKYIVDFYCADAKLVIELDGGQHDWEQVRSYDRIRTAFLNEYGLKVYRFRNRDIWNNFAGVCNAIDRLVKENLKRGTRNSHEPLKGSPTPRGAGAEGD